MPDPNDPQAAAQPFAPNPTAQNAPASPSDPQTPATVSNTPPQPSDQSQQGQPPQTGPFANPEAQPAVATSPQQAPIVTNAPPSIQRAGILRAVAQTLAGGPSYTTAIDPTTGATTRTEKPLSRGDIGMAIVAEILSGAMTGLGVSNGPGNLGRAAGSAFIQAQQQRQQADQQQEQQAQQDAKQKSDAFVRAASIADVNARTLLSTVEAEGRGADTLAKIVATNKPLIDAYDDAGQVLDHNVTQAELIAGMQGSAADAKYNSTAMLGPIDGYRLVGDGKVEATHAVIQNPATKLPLTQAMWDDLAANHVRGFPAGTKIGDGVTISGTQLAAANEQKTQFQLAQQRHDEVADAFRQSSDPKIRALADAIPKVGELLDDPKRGAGLAGALSRFQSYVSHSDISHGGRDLYESLQAMALPSRPDPNNKGKFVRNTDAPFANTVAQAFSPDGSVQGGWDVLKRFHEEVEPEQIANEAQAADMIARSKLGSRAYKYAQSWIASNTQQRANIAGAEARQREAAKPQPSPASLTTPDALGFTPTVATSKEADKRFGTFKKNLDSLSQSEQSYTQFQQALGEINQGKWTGADSVVALFNAIGLSATPLAGRGFRVSQNVIAEHQQARGWEGALQARLQGVATGAVITPQQLRDYAGIATQSRANQIVATANEMHAAGISADAALPSGNGQTITPDTAAIFMRLAGNDKAKARQAATQKGWLF